MRSHRLIGYLVIVIAIALSLELRAYRVDDTREVVIVREPRIGQINPYQTEYEKLLYPVVKISSPAGIGSGVIVTTDKHGCTQIFILTACHVVENENTVDIELYNSETITGTVVITDTVKDLALIKPQIHTDNTDKIYKARLAPWNYEAYLFSPVWAIGCSLGLEPRPSFGHITHIQRASASICGYEISAPILPGNSGGPVFDAKTYEVIGIAVWVKVYNRQLVTTMAGIVPINQIYDFLNNVATSNSETLTKPNKGGD